MFYPSGALVWAQMAGDDDELMFALYADEDSDIGPGGWANSVLR